MSTGIIIITLIICGTLVVMQIISAVEKANQRKEVNRKLQQFNKAFPTVKPTEKNNDNANDDLPKFGDF